MDLAGKKVLVVGLARTGTAVARFLLKRGSSLVIADDKPPDQLRRQIDHILEAAGGDSTRVRLCLGGTSPLPCANLAAVVLSPGVPVTHPTVDQAIRAGVPVISEIELAFRFLRGKIAGITGSNGKTTCTALIGAILAKRHPKTFISGNIGTPLIDRVEEDDESAWHAVELSSFQLETIDRFRPDVAVMLNLTPDHLDRYGNMEQYVSAKERIFMNQQPGDTAVLNADDALVVSMGARVRASTLWFSRRQPVRTGVFVRAGKILALTPQAAGEVMPVGEIPLRGAHNVENVLACAAAGLAAGAPPDQIAEAVRQFQGVAHRLEYVDRICEIAFFNDSKATNAGAALKALEAFDESLVVIMGGRDKGADFSVLIPAAERRVKCAILLGEAASKIREALGSRISCIEVADMREAVRAAFSRAAKGDVVLLAPACASFDMFRDYEQRGEIFKSEVRKLKEDCGEPGTDH